MKFSRGVMAGLSAAGFVVLLSAVSFADGVKEKDKVKLLNDSAVALQQSNHSLSAALTKFANEEANEIKSEKAEKNELEGKAEQEKIGEREAHIKLLRDSALALQKSNPELAQRLTKMADHSAKRMEKKKVKKIRERLGKKKRTRRSSRSNSVATAGQNEAMRQPKNRF